jgi:hypothetical protein
MATVAHFPLIWQENGTRTWFGFILTVPGVLRDGQLRPTLLNLMS